MEIKNTSPKLYTLKTSLIKIINLEEEEEEEEEKAEAALHGTNALLDT